MKKSFYIRIIGEIEELLSFYARSFMDKLQTKWMLVGSGEPIDWASYQRYITMAQHNIHTHLISHSLTSGRDPAIAMKSLLI